MAQLDQTAYEPALKIIYADGAIRNMVYQDNPLYALMAKDETFFGESRKEPIITANSQNRSNRFSFVNTINTTSVVKAFLLTRIQNYAKAAISNETIMASNSDKGAFIKALKFEMDGALHSLARSVAVQMYRSGTGSVARIGAGVLNDAAVPIYVDKVDAITNLETGMYLGFSAADGGTIKTGVAFITKINRAKGYFYVSATPGGTNAALTDLVATAATADYIYPNAGDVGAALSGLDAWLPATIAQNDSFFGVNRSIDETRLGGIQYDASAQSIEEGLQSAAALVSREGGRPTHCFMGFHDYNNLAKAMGAKQQVIQYSNVKVDEPNVTVGFTSLVVVGPKCTINVIPDQNCPPGKAYLLQLDTWTLHSLGEPVSLFDGDGLRMIRDGSLDNVVIQLFSYAQVGCRAPGYNCVVTLPS